MKEKKKTAYNPFMCGLVSYKPKNGFISDIYYRTVANLPLGNSYRLDFDKEWIELEKRIKRHYKRKPKSGSG